MAAAKKKKLPAYADPAPEPEPAPSPFSPAERSCINTLWHWVVRGRSSAAQGKLSELVGDPKSWRPPRARLRPRGGTLYWYRLTLLHELARRMSRLAELAALLRYIETNGREVDVPAIRLGCQLVERFIWIGIASRSRALAESTELVETKSVTEIRARRVGT
jgi:hypothetical protein